MSDTERAPLTIIELEEKHGSKFCLDKQRQNKNLSDSFLGVFSELEKMEGTSPSLGEAVAKAIDTERGEAW